MLEFYSGMYVREFGCKKLLVIQNQFVQLEYSRKYVNKLVSCLRQVFSWGVAQELCPVVMVDSLKHVSSLKKGKTDAPETTPRRKVADDVGDTAVANIVIDLVVVIDTELGLSDRNHKYSPFENGTPNMVPRLCESLPQQRGQR